MAAKTYFFKMQTNRRGRPISVVLQTTETPNAELHDATYLDPADGSKVPLDLTSGWSQREGDPPPDAFKGTLTRR